MERFREINREWQRSEKQLKHRTFVRTPPVYDYTYEGSMPTITVTKRHRRNTRSLYSVPKAFQEIELESLMCSQCDDPDRADKSCREPKPATHLCILMTGEIFRPVCGDCQSLKAFDYFVCLEACIPFTHIRKK